MCAFVGEGFSPVAQWAQYTLFLNVPASAAEMCQKELNFFAIYKEKKIKKKNKPNSGKFMLRGW